MALSGAVGSSREEVISKHMAESFQVSDLVLRCLLQHDRNVNLSTQNNDKTFLAGFYLVVLASLVRKVVNLDQATRVDITISCWFCCLRNWFWIIVNIIGAWWKFTYQLLHASGFGNPNFRERYEQVKYVESLSKT
jgi:hypothetical protein